MSQLSNDSAIDGGKGPTTDNNQYKSAAELAQFDMQSSDHARSRLDRDRYRSGLVLGLARSARGFSYISTIPIALVAHKKFLWKAVNWICVLQVV